MVSIARLIFVAISALLVCSVFAQGSAAGYGQQGMRGAGMGGAMGGGGGGGGFGGPGGLSYSAKAQARDLVPNGIDFISYNPNDNNLVTTNPDQDQTQGLWNSRSAILTPGDRVEFKYKVEKGETILASVTSDAFDPALSLEDSHGTVLAKNDDRVEGDQSPFISYHFPAAGEYVLKVLSYHSASGGKFELRSRTFISADMGTGPVTYSDVHPIILPNQRRFAFRIVAKKDQIFDLRSAYQRINLQGRNFQDFGLNFAGVIGPRGAAVADFKPIQDPDPTPLIQALVDGDFYVEYTASYIPPQATSTTFGTNLHLVSTIKAKSIDRQSIPMEPGELKLLEFPVKENEIVRTNIQGLNAEYTMTAPDAPNAEQIPNIGNNQGYGNTLQWAWFRLNIDSDKDQVRIFHGDGTVQMAIRSHAGTADTVVVENSQSIPEWRDGETSKNTLHVGDSSLFLIKSTKSELMRVYAKGDPFLVRLEIFRMNGDLANTLINRKTLVATDDLYFPDEAIFVARISCEGNGGAGEYELRRESLKPSPYQLGTAQTVELNGKNFGLYSVNLEAGKRYELLIDHTELPLQYDLLDQDGQFLSSQGLWFPGITTQYFVPTRSGVHRLWIRGAPGKHEFKFRPFAPPTINGPG